MFELTVPDLYLSEDSQIPIQSVCEINNGSLNIKDWHGSV